MAKQNYDLTSGGILKKLLLVALPIMGTQLMQMAYNLVDIFFLGRIGSDAVAASSTAGTYMWLVSGAMLIGRMGAEIGVSQSIGRGEEGQAQTYCRTALQIGVSLGAVLGLVMICFGRQLVSFFAIQEENVVRDAVAYLGIVGVGVPFTYITAAIVGTFNGSGNSRTPFLINGGGLALNIILDPLMIFGFRMGVVGAAVATATAQILVALSLLWALKRSKNRPFQAFHLRGGFSREHAKRVFRWALPVCAESMFFTLCSMTTSRFLAGYGAGALAMTKVGVQVESLSWLVGGGYGSAVTAFVGQNYGAGQQKRIDRCVNMSLIVMGIWGLCVTGMLMFFGGNICLLFLPERELLPIAQSYMFIIGLCQVPTCLEGVGTGALRGCGKTMSPATASVLSNMLRVVFAWILKGFLGLEGIYWGIHIATVVRGLWICLNYFLYRRSLKTA